LSDRQHLTIDEVSFDDEPLLPKNNTNTFVIECRVFVRDMVPIRIQEWDKPAKGDGVSYVSDIAKKMLWESLSSHFTLPVFEDEKLKKKIRLKVQQWALKNMAAQFNNHKKRLYNVYLKAGR
jgi:hypothetical protein